MRGKTHEVWIAQQSNQSEDWQVVDVQGQIIASGLTEQNAKLIAASTDMLELLKFAVGNTVLRTTIEEAANPNTLNGGAISNWIRHAENTVATSENREPVHPEYARWVENVRLAS